MLRKGWDELDQIGEKGDWCFLNGEEFIAIRFGEDAFTGTVIIPIAINVMPGSLHWKWDGNKEAPTLSPSILVHGNPGWSKGWHGFLEKGILRTV
jgi:hypothetical protein